MKKVFMVVLALTMAIGVITAAMASSSPTPATTAAPQQKRTGFENKLKLTADQKQKILVIRQQFEKDTLQLRQDLQKKQMELRELWKANPVDQAAVNAKQAEMTPLRVQMMTKMRAMKEQLKGVLTPEQLKQIEQMKAKRGEGHEFRGKGGFGKRGFMMGEF